MGLLFVARREGKINNEPKPHANKGQFRGIYPPAVAGIFCEPTYICCVLYVCVCVAYVLCYFL